MKLLSLAGSETDSQVYAVLVSASLVLSVWGAYAQFVPNPDAVHYLRAAELFANGQWSEGAEVYRWPFYSASVAFVIALTGASALAAAHTVNALLDAATAVIFVALVGRLAGDSRRIVLWAALFILMHPKLMQLRPLIIRDHGFFAFFLLALYLLVVDRQSPSIMRKLGIAGAIALATLFRLEGAFLFLIVPAFYFFDRSSSFAAKAAVVAVVLLVCGLFVPGYSLWTGTNAFSTSSVTGVVGGWSGQIENLFKHMHVLSGQLEKMLPPGRNVGALAYAGIVWAITLDVLLRALTMPIAVLAIFAFLPRRLLPEFATRFVGWFAWWQLPLLLTFMAFALFLDWRYAMAFALVGGIPAVFALEAAAHNASFGGRREKLVLYAAVGAIVIPFMLAVPKVSNLSYMRDAGYWIRDELPVGTGILTNEGRLAYFSGRAYEREIRFRVTEGLKDSLPGADYLLLHIHSEVSPSMPGIDQAKIVATFKGEGDGRIVAYRLR